MKLLNQIESIGNRLPHPAALFVIGTAVIMLLSQLAAMFDWRMQSPTGGELETHSLISMEGIWWLLSHMVENFIKFPPLGIVLVGMLGIGMAERSGFLPALLRYLMRHTPQSLLTPATLFLGIMSSLALDAGYVVLPPLAAALYQAAGRSPLTGIAVAFAGVSAGFSANLLITPLDPLLTGFTQSAASIIAPDYRVAVTANWWFMMVSTVLLTLTGWVVTNQWAEPMSAKYTVTEIVSGADASQSTREQKSLRRALLTMAITLFVFVLCIALPGAPLYGNGDHFARWIEVTVPLLFLVFVIPGIVFGINTGTIKNDKDAAVIMGDTLSDLGPYIVLAFFAAQFIESFKYSGLGEMLSISGGQFLASLPVPVSVFLIGFILLVMFADLFIGSASAKYAFMAPVFVPMLMQVGLSPELTQAAYRIGDSVANVITPLNPYMVIILALVQKYVRGSGIGTIIALMLPYTAAFAIVWGGILLLWLALGIPPDRGGQLYFTL
jgi:Putative p-aminobenzoyl-glutamate transporter